MIVGNDCKTLSQHECRNPVREDGPLEHQIHPPVLVGRLPFLVIFRDG